MQISQDYPLQETVINDLFAEDIERVEMLGDHVRLVFWRWKQEAGIWQRVTLDWAMILPVRALRMPIEQWPQVRITKPPHEADTMLH